MSDTLLIVADSERDTTDLCVGLRIRTSAVLALVVSVLTLIESLPAAELLDGPGERHRFGVAVNTLLAEEDFKTLDAIADHLREKRARFQDGTWKLPMFYDGVETPWETDKDSAWQEWLAKMDRWQRANPSSITAPVAMARTLTAYAWKARGNEYAKHVTAEGWKLFAERLAQARAVLDDSAKRPARCPGWYHAMQVVALGQGWTLAEYDALFNEAVAKEPAYYHYYFAKAHYLLPRWHGEAGDWQRFAEAAAAKAGPWDGPVLYARIVWATGDWDYKPKELFQAGRISWPLMKQGFENIERDFPGSNWNLNNFCKFAADAGDRATARKLIDRIGARYHVSAWFSRVNYENCWHWTHAP
ncbi:MAG: DUF4034 domain-containing protein [Verrucomicrobia bacterium]|nr:DUF4034 domain-containing protein [Verrucomicrobiota bacterium]